MRRTAALLAAMLGGLAALATPAGAAVHRVVLDGPVDPVHVAYVVRAIDQAEAEGSALVLLVLDTPGGLADAMETLLRRMLASRVPVCAYVHPSGGRAASAGFFLLVSADVAAMAPGTRTGSAHPVFSIGGVLPVPEEPRAPDKAPDKAADKPADKPADKAPAAPPPKPAPAAGESTMMTKVREDIQAYLRGVVERRGRNVAAAERAVSESRSYTDQEALSEHLIDLVAASEWELMARLDGREVRLLDGTVRVLATRDQPIVTVEMTRRERALAFLTNPNVAFLLLLIGALLIYVEVTHAGMYVPGVVGGLCLLMAVTGFSFLPVSVTGVLLVLAAIGLFVAEALVTSHGVLGVAGAVSLALGGIMLVDLPDEGVGVDPWLAVSAAAGFGAIAVLLGTLALRSARRPVATGAEGLAGLEGEALTALDPHGKVFCNGEYWDAVASRPVPKGGRVRVVSMSGLVLSVEPAEPPAEDAP